MTNTNVTPKILSTKLFGDFSRFKLVEFRTRFNTTCWLVEDAEKMDKLTGLPEIIIQEDDREIAIQKALALQ